MGTMYIALLLGVNTSETVKENSVGMVYGSLVSKEGVSFDIVSGRNRRVVVTNM